MTDRVSDQPSSFPEGGKQTPEEGFSESSEDRKQLSEAGLSESSSLSARSALKHLEFIQGAINRLSMNSFLLKGWSVVLVAALLVIGATAVPLAFVPAVIFWGLDGFFLWQERIYRKMYDGVRTKEVDDVDLSMCTDDLSDGVTGWLGATFSRTLIPFHGVLIVTIATVIFLQS